MVTTELTTLSSFPQYPPGLQKVLKEKKDFAQLEDFNRGHDDEEYQKAYHQHLR